MMRLFSFGAALLVVALVACGDLSEETPPAPLDERTPIGVSPYEYCERLGGTVTSSDAGASLCRFANDDSCEIFALYRGECGQSHTACAKAGGAISTFTFDGGTWSPTFSLCTLSGGGQCFETDFAVTGQCLPPSQR